MKIISIISFLLISLGTSFGQSPDKMNIRIRNLQNQVKEASSDSLKRKAIVELADALSVKAFMRTNMGDIATAFEVYSLVFELLDNPEVELFFKNSKEERGYWREFANATFNFGHVMGSTGNKTERKLYYEKAYQIANEHGIRMYASFGLAGLAYIDLGNMELDSAEYKIEKALLIQINEKDPAVGYINGSIKLALGQLDRAKGIFLDGFDFAIEKDSLEEIVLRSLGLSRTYRQMNNPDSSYYYGMKSLESLSIIKEIRVLDIGMSTVYENLHRHFLKFNQPDSTLKYLQLAFRERELFNDKKINSLAAFQQVLLKKERLYSELEKEKVTGESRNRIYILFIFLVIVSLIAAFILFGYRQKQKANDVLGKALINLKSAQSQLIQSEKMASLGELTAGIAHEIQNPLNFVNNFSELSEEMIKEIKEERLKSKDQRDEVLEEEILTDIKGNLQKINHHGNRASSIVKGMLEHSRASSGKKELTDINALADEYLRLSYHGLRAKDKTFNVALVTDYDTNVPKVEVIPQDIGRVLLNLINNAFQAVHEKSLMLVEEGGRSRGRVITKDGDGLEPEVLDGGILQDEASSVLQETSEGALASGTEDYKPMVSITTKLTANGQLLIVIEDNGSGIPEEIKDKIFQPFFTTKDTGKGIGLGLSLAYDIVMTHGGKITLGSKLTNGTEFIVLLPVK